MMWGKQGVNMPTTKREKTKYPGIFSSNVRDPQTGKETIAFYARYRKGTKLIEEKLGLASRGWTAARANQERGKRIEGRELSNRERREYDEARSARWTFAKLWGHYLEHKRVFKGRRRDSAIFEKHIRPTFGDQEPQELAPFHVQAFRVKLEKRLAPQSVKNILALLRRIALYGQKNALCPGLPFQVQVPKKINNTVKDFLDEDDARRVMAACDAHPNREGANLVKLALLTGLRAEELFRLEWGHVDFCQDKIKVIDSKSGVDDIIPMNASARKLLEGHPRSNGSPYVFPGRGGKRRVSVSWTSRAIREAAGLPVHIRPLHDLRHAFASLLASSGKVNLHELQTLLRHSDPRVTLRYAHLVDKALQRASRVLDDIL